MNRKEHYKDLNRFAETKRKQAVRYHARTRYFTDETLYKRYTEEETQMILQKKMSDRELAKLLRRSVSAIQSRRHKLIHKAVSADE